MKNTSCYFCIWGKGSIYWRLTEEEFDLKSEEKFLIAQLKLRNRQAYYKLFQTYYKQLVRYAEGIIYDADNAKDIVQDLFVFIWDNAESVDINSSIKGYLFRSVRNRCLNEIKSLGINANRNLLYFEGLSDFENLDEVADKVFEFKTDAILKAVKSLPSKMRKIFEMKYFQKQKYKNIAETLGISENTVKTHLMRAKEKLRSELSDLS